MQSLINTDKYWGEFSEKEMDILLSLCEKKDFGGAKKFIEEKLERTDFIFGQARSDFLYLSPINSESVCLDVGCGLGVHTFNMAKITKEVHACDLSKKRVQFCEYRKEMENLPNVHFYHSDIESLPFENEKFDFIVMNGVVEWLGEKNKNADPRADQLEDLRKIYSLLKKGGTLYIGIENRFAATYLHNAKDHNRLKYTSWMPRSLANLATKIFRGKPYRTYTYGEAGYRKLLEETGFNERDTRFYVAHPGYNLPQYLIDFTDDAAFKFFFNHTGKNAYLKRLFGNKFLVQVVKRLFYSYVIFVKK